jgi:hypothetical protein
MQTFELYGTAWVVYLLLGIALLALIGFKIKQLSWSFQFGILSFLAVGAFTPAIVSSSNTYAPLVITALLNAEVEGSSAIVSGLIQLVIVWGIIFFAGLAIRHFWFARSKG